MYERTETGYNAYVPDLPGCVGAAATLDTTRELMGEALEFHSEGMRMRGEEGLQPTTIAEGVEVRIAEVA